MAWGSHGCPPSEQSKSTLRSPEFPNKSGLKLPISYPRKTKTERKVRRKLLKGIIVYYLQTWPGMKLGWRPAHLHLLLLTDPLAFRIPNYLVTPR